MNTKKIVSIIEWCSLLLAIVTAVYMWFAVGASAALGRMKPIINCNYYLLIICFAIVGIVFSLVFKTSLWILPTTALLCAVTFVALRLIAWGTKGYFEGGIGFDYVSFIIHGIPLLLFIVSMFGFIVSYEK